MGKTVKSLKKSFRFTQFSITLQLAYLPENDVYSNEAPKFYYNLNI